MILEYADELLSERLKEVDDYEILRYRDDYRIFFNEKSKVERIMKELTEVLRHKRIKTTQKYCISSTKEDKEKVGRVSEKSLKN